ncbi:hypothetical protein BDM02DRAFT_3264295 [Thelephora ganbajun]|uniref:Uncharacterized protein n=1 Tax=Thelephora ganbajun TaxID=370292 RepID=A0ACB6Z0E6_THEGA|nr:hypothetical protein BDM02DRAFT_3264295 [Thelephora ganbajun]
MVTKTLGACMACRARKVKCIPGTPRCARCTAVGIEDCRYGSVKKRGPGSILRMGQACIPCRQRKTKCDAKKPCTKCVSMDRDAECIYESRKRSNLTAANALTHERTSGPLNPRHLPLQTSANVLFEPSTSPPRNLPLLTWSNPNTSTSSYSPFLDPPSAPTVQLPWEPSPRVQGEEVLGLSSDVELVRKTHGTAKCLPRPIISSFTILPSIHFQTISHPLRMPLSLIPPEHVQVSGVAGSDLDMTFRLRSLCRLNKLGIYFIQEKQEALLRGDTSGTVINRYFIHGLQATGMHLCGVPEETPAMVLLQARYAQMAWESLIEFFKTDQQKDKVQGIVLLVHAFIIMGFTSSAQFYLSKMCKIIDKAKLQFLPAYGRPAGLSEQVREDASVLSQVIYLENFFYLTLGGPAPVMTTRIEREFRLDLQRVYPHLFDICPLTMRTQSILLVREAILVLDPCSDDQNASGRGESRHQLIHALDRFSNDLIRNLQRFIIVEDGNGVGTIWACCVTCLGHLVALCHLTSQTEPALSKSMDGLYNLTLDKLGNLSLEVHIEEYSHFDFLTGMSWKRALDTIDVRIGLYPSAESGSLRYWKRVIGKTYADFQANSPGYGPTVLASLAMTVDGRTEDSGFPNLVVPGERELYGF